MLHPRASQVLSAGAFLAIATIAFTPALRSQPRAKAGDAAIGTQKYDSYERPAACASGGREIERKAGRASIGLVAAF